MNLALCVWYLTTISVLESLQVLVKIQAHLTKITAQKRPERQARALVLGGAAGYE